MNALRPGEISSMKATQSDAMGDLFVIGVHTETPGADGGLADGYTNGAPQIGAIVAPNTKAVYMADKTLLQADAILRTDGAASLTVGDRITVISRGGAACPSEIYYVSGEKRTFSTAAVYPLMRTAP